MQVDVLQLILHHPELTDTTRQQVTAFLKSKFYNLILQNEEQADFEADELGIPMADWTYIRQKLLTGEGVKPAKQNLTELKVEVDGL